MHTELSGGNEYFYYLLRDGCYQLTHEDGSYIMSQIYCYLLPGTTDLYCLWKMYTDINQEWTPIIGQVFQINK